MNPPAYIQDGHLRITVSTFPDAARAESGLYERGEDGLAIRLSRGCSPGRLAEVFIHELIHHIYAEAACDLRDEEEFVTRASHRLASILAQNPKLLPWLAHLLESEKAK